MNNKPCWIKTTNTKIWKSQLKNFQICFFSFNNYQDLEWPIVATSNGFSPKPKKMEKKNAMCSQRTRENGKYGRWELNATFPTSNIFHAQERPTISHTSHLYPTPQYIFSQNLTLNSQPDFGEETGEKWRGQKTRPSRCWIIWRSRRISSVASPTRYCRPSSPCSQSMKVWELAFYQRDGHLCGRRQHILISMRSVWYTL